MVAAIERISREHGPRRRIFRGGGSAFLGGHVDLLMYNDKVRLNVNRRGKQTDKAIVVFFFEKFREGCLSAHWIETLEDASEKIDAWR